MNNIYSYINNNSNNNNCINRYNNNNEDIIYKYLKKYFGLSTFKPNQLDIIKHTLQGFDSFVSIATGGGKSLCYQLPSLILKKTTIVISPLKSLISDQTIKLKSLGIKAIKLSTDIKSNSIEYENIFNGYYRIVFITPERLANEIMSINRLVEKGNCCLFAIDECHCISQWGIDFRPSYRQLTILREMFPNIPIMSLTATSTSEIEKDIIQSFKFEESEKNFKIFRSPKNRENIFYKAIYKDSIQEKDYEMILKIINETRKSIGGHLSNSTIIYCPTIQTSIDLNRYLSRNSILSNCYHSQMNDNQRDQALKEFLFNKTEVICATIAFGMGIDKSDIRVIIHYGPSKSVEEYYQESGRAGRDGLPSLSLVFFSLQDFTKSSLRINFNNNQENRSNKIDKLTQIKNILVNRSECRRKAILSVFNENYIIPLNSLNGCGGCDNCTEEKDTSNLLDLSFESKLLINCIFEAGQNCGMKTIISILRGSNSSDLAAKHLKNSNYGKGSSFSIKFWKELSNQLKTLNYLIESSSSVYTITKFGKKGYELFKSSGSDSSKVLIESNKILKDEFKLTNYYKNQLNKTTLISKINNNNNSNSNNNNNNNNNNDNDNSNSNGIISKNWNSFANTLDPNTQGLFQILVQYRKSLSTLIDIPEFLLFSEKTLKSIAEYRPSTLDSLRMIEGLEEKKIRDHGNSILLKVEEFCKKKSLNFDNFKNQNKTSNKTSTSTTSTSTSTSTTTSLNINNSNNNTSNKQIDKNNISTIFNIIKGFNSPPKSNVNNNNNIIDTPNINNNNNINRSSSTGSLNSSSSSIGIGINSRSNSSNSILGEKRKSDLINEVNSKRFRIVVNDLTFEEIYNHKPSITPINYTQIKSYFKSIRDESYRNKTKRIPSQNDNNNSLNNNNINNNQ